MSDTRAGAGGRRTSETLGGREGVRNEDSEMVCRFRWATGGHDQEEQLLGKSRRTFRNPVKVFGRP